MFAGAMAVLMVLSAVNVSGWGVMNAKAEETAVQVNDSAGKTEQQSTEEEECKHEGVEITFNSNGFGNCPKCNAIVYQPAVETTDKYDIDDDSMKETVYEISNADQLYWFANKINNENYTSGNINAVLTADIVVNENVLKSDGTLNDGSFTDWTPIGMWAGDDKYYSYSGIFDGQNHTISGLYLNQMGMAGCVGLFGHVGSGGKVSNVRVLDSYFSVNGGVGGVCGYNDGTITNCYNAGMINKLTDDYTNDFGGVCGYNTGTIIDCYNTGNVSGVNYNGGVCGDNDGTIINCYKIVVVSGDYHVGDICGDNYGATVTNCYYLSDTEIDHKDGTVGKTKEQFANGEVAYLLQADRTETIWGQTIGTDLYPVLGGKKVYQNKEYDSCNENGNVVAITYSNEQENKFTHTLVKTDRKADCVTAGEDEYWTCSVCGKMFCDKEGENEISSIPVIDALGHDFAKDFTVDAEATCKNVGSKSRHCIRCDAKTDVTEIPASGHNMKKVPAKEATEKETSGADTEELDNQIGSALADKLRGELELIDGVYPEFQVEEYLKGELAPVFFGSALNNFGVQELLDCFVEIAPSPRPVKAEEREVEPEEPKFTGFIFKITANIDPNHRSCIAFCKICSGKFTRNTPYLHVRHGKTMRFSSPTQFMAQRKTTIDEAWAGDIIGLPDNGTFKIGDTLTEGEMLHFRGLPSFSPEMFKYIENADPMKQKQLAKGIDQLMDEGVAQLFVNQFNGRKIIGTVGQLQFEVIQYRLENEYSAKCRWEPLSLYKACWIESDDPAELESFKKRKYQYMAKDREGRDVFLADSGYVLQMAQMDFKHIKFHFTSEF